MEGAPQETLLCGFGTPPPHTHQLSAAHIPFSREAEAAVPKSLALLATGP